MEVKVTSVIVGFLMALVVILSYFNYQSAKKIDEIHSILFDPDKTNVRNN